MLTVSTENAVTRDVDLGPTTADRKHDPRTEILRSSSDVIASRGVRITMRQIAQSSGKSFGARQRSEQRQAAIRQPSLRVTPAVID
jgi:hypothetical protein